MFEDLTDVAFTLLVVYFTMLLVLDPVFFAWSVVKVLSRIAGVRVDAPVSSKSAKSHARKSRKDKHNRKLEKTASLWSRIGQCFAPKTKGRKLPERPPAPEAIRVDFSDDEDDHCILSVPDYFKSTPSSSKSKLSSRRSSRHSSRRSSKSRCSSRSSSRSVVSFSKGLVQSKDSLTKRISGSYNWLKNKVTSKSPKVTKLKRKKSRSKKRRSSSKRRSVSNRRRSISKRRSASRRRSTSGRRSPYNLRSRSKSKQRGRSKSKSRSRSGSRKSCSRYKIKPTGKRRSRSRSKSKKTSRPATTLCGKIKKLNICKKNILSPPSPPVKLKKLGICKKTRPPSPPPNVSSKSRKGMWREVVVLEPANVKEWEAWRRGDTDTYG